MIPHPARCVGSRTVAVPRLSEDPTISVRVLEAGCANLNDDPITASSRPSAAHFPPSHDAALPCPARSERTSSNPTGSGDL